MERMFKCSDGSVVKAFECYRVENQCARHGIWRDFDGNYRPVFDFMLPSGKVKDLPMNDNPLYREGGKVWFAAAPSIETLKEWVSKRDVCELQKWGFKIYEFVVREYKKVSDNECVFTRESVLNSREVNLNEI